VLTTEYRLGIAYAGSAQEDLMELISPVFEDPKASMEVVGIAALALGMIFVGSAHGEVGLVSFFEPYTNSCC